MSCEVADSFALTAREAARKNTKKGRGLPHPEIQYGAICSARSSMRLLSSRTKRARSAGSSVNRIS